MPSQRQRLLELALESLQAKRRQLDEEIAAINDELRGRGVKKTAAKLHPSAPTPAKKRKSRFTQEERLRRSQRMKDYWDKWRKERAKGK